MALPAYEQNVAEEEEQPTSVRIIEGAATQQRACRTEGSAVVLSSLPRTFACRHVTERGAHATPRVVYCAYGASFRPSEITGTLTSNALGPYDQRTLSALRRYRIGATLPYRRYAATPILRHIETQAGSTSASPPERFSATAEAFTATLP